MTNERIADEICEAVIKECGPRVWITVGSDGGMEFKDRIVKALEAKDAANSEQAKMEWALRKMKGYAKNTGNWIEVYGDGDVCGGWGKPKRIPAAARAILNQKGTK
jgi:hypothetical protein